MLKALTGHSEVNPKSQAKGALLACGRLAECETTKLHIKKHKRLYMPTVKCSLCSVLHKLNTSPENDP